MNKQSQPMTTQTDILVYQGDAGVKMTVKTDGETVWLTQEQMCQLFGRDRSVITKHIRNIFKEGELPQEGYVQNLHITSDVGGRPVSTYNLDVVISVGYRVKSIEGTRFRQWATRVLREMLLNRLRRRRERPPRQALRKALIKREQEGQARILQRTKSGD